MLMTKRYYKAYFKEPIDNRSAVTASFEYQGDLNTVVRENPNGLYIFVGSTRYFVPWSNISSVRAG